MKLDRTTTALHVPRPRLLRADRIHRACWLHGRRPTTTATTIRTAAIRIRALAPASGARQRRADAAVRRADMRASRGRPAPPARGARVARRPVAAGTDTRGPRETRASGQRPAMRARSAGGHNRQQVRPARARPAPRRDRHRRHDRRRGNDGRGRDDRRRGDHRRRWDHGRGGDTGAGGSQGNTCRVTTDCRPNECCVSGMCQPLPSTTPVCHFNSECGAGGRCRNGRCERPCTASTSCGTGDACVGGFCQPDPDGGGQCVLSTNCSGAHLRQRPLPRRLPRRRRLRPARPLRGGVVPRRRSPATELPREHRLQRRPDVRERQLPHGLRHVRGLLHLRRRQCLRARLLRHRRRSGARLPARRRLLLRPVHRRRLSMR